MCIDNLMSVDEIRNSIIAQARKFPAPIKPNTVVVSRGHFYKMKEDIKYSAYFSFDESMNPTHYMGLKLIVACDNVDVIVLYQP